MREFDVRREFEESFEILHLFASFSGRVTEERGESTDHFVQNDSDAPLVDSFVLACILEHFGGDLVWGPHSGLRQNAPVFLLRFHVFRPRNFSVFYQFLHVFIEVIVNIDVFAQAEVNEFDVAL